jgi:alpha-ketoglutaric semialdehyde dehydrogenase
MEPEHLKISGQSIIGFRSATDAGPSFRAANPRTGERLAPDFFPAQADDVNASAILAHEAFATYSQTSGREKGKLLRTIAVKIEGAVDEIVERAEQESALPKPRLQGETAQKDRGSWPALTVQVLTASRHDPICVPCCIRWAR